VVGMVNEAEGEDRRREWGRLGKEGGKAMGNRLELAGMTPSMLLNLSSHIHNSVLKQLYSTWDKTYEVFEKAGHYV
jgi:hypothetical protein